MSARQTQQLPSNPGVPGIDWHFWNKVYNKGRTHSREDGVRNTWGGICNFYFPSNAAEPDWPLWCVRHDHFEDIPLTNPSRVAVAELLIPGEDKPPAEPNPYASRDYLWVKTEPACKDTPSG